MTKRAAAEALHGVAIVGAYNTRQALSLDEETSETVTFQAVRGALTDAGLTVRDIDGFNVMVGFGDTLPLAAQDGPYARQGSQAFGYAVGATLFWAGTAMVGIPAVMEAALAIAAGECEVALIASGQAGLYRDRTAVAPWTRPANEFIECWGQFTTAEFALLAREHMHRFGTTPEQIAHIAAVIRNNGYRNPEAVFHGRGPYTASDVLASRMIADPYHLLDCAIASEGGSAIVLTTAERAKDCRSEAVAILGAGREYWAPGYTHPPTYDRIGLLGRGAADAAFAQAGISRADVDVAEFYDNFSWEIIRYLEAFRFCEAGEGGAFVESGAIEPGGSLPICTDGGVMSHSHTGMSQNLQKIVQCVRQIRGESAANQVPSVEVALASFPGQVILLGKGG